MGQQQALLMVLLVVIIGTAIRVGLRVADEQNMQQNRDQLIAQMQNIYAFAEQYATKSISQGGGAGTYTGFKLPKAMSKTSVGTLKATVSGKKNLTIVGTGVVKGNNGKAVVRVTYTINARKLKKVAITN